VSLIDEAGLEYALGIAERLRAAGLSTESHMVPTKLGRQLRNADRAGIRFVVIAGEDERSQTEATVKDLTTGEQSLVDLDALVDHIRSRISRQEVR
jgi:histidyl-tRNA synthetase